MGTSEVLLIMYGPVIGYLALTSISHGKKINSVGETMDRVEKRFDLFLKTEIDTLKEIAKNVRG